MRVSAFVGEVRTIIDEGCQPTHTPKRPNTNVPKASLHSFDVKVCVFVFVFVSALVTKCSCCGEIKHHNHNHNYIIIIIIIISSSLASFA